MENTEQIRIIVVLTDKSGENICPPLDKTFSLDEESYVLKFDAIPLGLTLRAEVTISLSNGKTASKVSDYFTVTDKNTPEGMKRASFKNCEYAFLSVQKNTNMINCPRLVTPQQIYEWQSLLIYHKTDNQYTIKRACEIDENRPWHIPCPPIIYNKDLLMRK